MRARILTLLTYTILNGIASTAQVPILLKDINPTGNSNPIGFKCFGAVTYFSATDGVNGNELWKTDGTEEGTVMVKDISPGSDNTNPTNFMAMNGLVYFIKSVFGSDLELWRTDGTADGTQLAIQLTDVPGLQDWITFVAFPGSGPGGTDRIFFCGQDADHGRELWSTDGTAAGTALFLDIHPGLNNSGFDSPMAYDGDLYFTANDGTAGSEPWICDGTVAGTHMIAETVPGPSSTGTSPSRYAAAGGLVYFRAGTSATGDELWGTDGTVAGTGVVRDIYPGTNSSSPSYLIEHNGQLHLRASPTSGSSAALIWKSDGTQAGTVSLPTFGYTNPDNLCSHDGSLYFTALGTGNRQIWRTDGTAPGTSEILFPGSDVSSPTSSTPMLSCNGDLLFQANYMAATGAELYTLNTTTGHDEHAEGSTRLYPNPASTQLHLTGFPPTSYLNLYTTDGRLVMSGTSQPQLNISALPAGVYAACVIDQDSAVLHNQLVVIER